MPARSKNTTSHFLNAVFLCVSLLFIGTCSSAQVNPPHTEAESAPFDYDTTLESSEVMDAISSMLKSVTSKTTCPIPKDPFIDHYAQDWDQSQTFDYVGNRHGQTPEGKGFLSYNELYKAINDHELMLVVKALTPLMATVNLYTAFGATTNLMKVGWSRMVANQGVASTYVLGEAMSKSLGHGLNTTGWTQSQHITGPIAGGIGMLVLDMLVMANMDPEHKFNPEAFTHSDTFTIYAKSIAILGNFSKACVTYLIGYFESKGYSPHMSKVFANGIVGGLLAASVDARFLLYKIFSKELGLNNEGAYYVSNKYRSIFQSQIPQAINMRAAYELFTATEALCEAASQEKFPYAHPNRRKMACQLFMASALSASVWLVLNTIMSPNVFVQDFLGNLVGASALELADMLSFVGTIDFDNLLFKDVSSLIGSSVFTLATAYLNEMHPQSVVAHYAHNGASLYFILGGMDFVMSHTPVLAYYTAMHNSVRFIRLINTIQSLGFVFYRDENQAFNGRNDMEDNHYALPVHDNCLIQQARGMVTESYETNQGCNVLKPLAPFHYIWGIY